MLLGLRVLVVFKSDWRNIMTKFVKYIKNSGWSGWLYSIAVVEEDCPRCGAPKEHYCATPRGKKVWPPHGERLHSVKGSPRFLT